MKVLINPSREESGSGLASSIAWQNPDVIRAINQMFAISAHEQIVQIEITPDGITARMEYRP